MPQQLSQAEAERFGRDGVLFPVSVMERDEVDDRLRRLEEIESRMAGRLPPAMNLKSHLLVPWIWDLVHDPRIVDSVESLLGPDILCWGTSFFNKQAHSPDYVPWHQDATYWGLSAPVAVTAWVALTPSVPENGCMRVVPGTHSRQLAHADNLGAANMLARQEELVVAVDEDEAVDVVLEPGQMSLHHVLIVHGSKPNGSDLRRVGLAIRYIAGHVETVGDRNWAALVRGRDHGHFDLEQEPQGEFDPGAMARHAAILRRSMKVVFREARRDRSSRGAHPR
jgi:Phytanoyl-CoA dioxygenase (PhyH)